MFNKYGKKVKPYEVSLRINQDETLVEREKIEYSYSLKNFEQNDVIYEREYRVIEIQDPDTYRGELAAQKTSIWTDTYKCFIVNGKIEKADANF
jgi:hypothetical protein